ncbi:ThiF family protein [Histomonas meleagridis]|uniref:ThiF family protein n=1 Tax=Histomonas meleagridis TaxID=135588 RepID=UPI00355A80C1|nr:ThiF family protein [Histomonas meleagridis]KAH0796375.1 ThiF family protein [Histomonas meleagridis]
MTEESERYDRQIRLWGVHGQKDINEATILFAGSDCVASEFLKNMVLHGVQNVIIVDDAIVTENDLGSNFFVDKDSLGKPRAETVANLLNELNPSTKIEAVLKSPIDISFMDHPKLNEQAIILTSGNLPPSFLKQLSKICRERHMRQAHIQTTGLFGAFYIDAGLHHFFEGSVSEKNPISELRISNPFEELKEFWESIDFDSLSDQDHAHIPYCAILHQAANILKKELNTDTLTRKDMNQLREIIEKMERNSINEENNTMNEEECFEEAINNMNYLLNPPRIPLLTQECFELSDTIGDVNEPFWQLVKSTQRFYQKHGVIPHYGGCPDMETTPYFYQIQKGIYHDKSDKDWNEIAEDLNNLGINIDQETFDRFRQNVWRIGGVNYMPIEQSIELKPEMYYDDTSRYLAIVQLLFVAAREFVESNGRIPTNTNEDKEWLINKMKDLSAPEEDSDKFVAEFCRAKGEVLPSVVASFAAILAEEITKIIIHQAHPVKSVVVFDGVHSILTTQG